MGQKMDLSLVLNKLGDRQFITILSGMTEILKSYAVVSSPA